MPALPSGTVTFLFTDIEGSTKLWEQHPEAMRLALARHDLLLRQAIESNNGAVFKTVGDAFCAAFAAAPDALKAALEAHLALQQQPWSQTGPVRVRIGLHTGVAEERDGDYFGPTLNRVARLQSIGYGLQTLLSETTCQLVRDRLPEGVTLLDQGQHRLKDLLAAEHIWQLQHPSLPSEFPPLKSLDYLPTNLPRQMASFVGRQAEMAEAKQLLSSTPLLTLTGIGGTGKTRLAVQVGAEALEDYQDGVWLVELAALTAADLVPQTVATALGLREETGRAMLQTVQDYLRDRHLLLILDNCEHLVAASAHLANALLRTCPRVTILATSREPLGLVGERSWRVPSLPTLNPADLPPEEKDVGAVLMEYDACRLFVDRAVLQRQDFRLTRRNASAVASVCHRLDGIPLAIELAAARVRSLSVEEIDGRLDDRFRLLSGGNRTALPRQQTLRAAIDWSYDLLTPQERRLLARLAVFAGGWTLAAAEQVGVGAASTGESIEDWEVIDLLAGLVDKSLVIAQPQGEATRYHLLETVRQYARDRLAESEESLVFSARHRDCFLLLAEEASPKLNGSEQAEWLATLETEHANLRQALTFSLHDAEGGEKGLRLCGALQGFWRAHGHLSEGREHVAAALAHPGAQEGTRAHADALKGAGVLAILQSDYAAARSLLEANLAIRRELGDQSGIAAALGNLGVVAQAQGDYASARALYEEALAISRELGNQWTIAAVLGNLGNVAQEQGDYAGARSLHEESLGINRELGDLWSITISLGNLGVVAYEQGDYASACSLHEESLPIKRGLGDKRGIAATLNNLGNVVYEQGDYVAARSLHEDSLALRRELGEKIGIADSLSNLGNVAHEQSDYALARLLHEESLAIQQELGNKRGIAISLGNLGNLAHAQGDYVSACSLQEESLALRRELGDKSGIAASLGNLGNLAYDQGGYASARSLAEESLTIRRELGDKRGIALCLEAFASLAAKEKRVERAARIGGAAEALRSALGSPRSTNQREGTAVREALGSEAFTAAWEEGRAMTWEQAVADALEEQQGE